jgi:hypothetical protein
MNMGTSCLSLTGWGERKVTLYKVICFPLLEPLILGPDFTSSWILVDRHTVLRHMKGHRAMYTINQVVVALSSDGAVLINLYDQYPEDADPN